MPPGKCGEQRGCEEIAVFHGHSLARLSVTPKCRLAMCMFCYAAQDEGLPSIAVPRVAVRAGCLRDESRAAAREAADAGHASGHSGAVRDPGLGLHPAAPCGRRWLADRPAAD